MNKIYYLPTVSFQNYSLGIYEIKFIKDINLDYILGSPRLIWNYGEFPITQQFSKEASFYNKNYLVETLEDCFPKLYEHSQRISEIVELNKNNSLENIKLAEELLKEEKQLAKDRMKEYKQYFQQFKNINFEKLVRIK